MQDGKSFLHIPSWSNNNTELLAVTLGAGPCQAATAERSGTPQEPFDWQPALGCNLVAADNATLVPMLLANASMRTSEPLLIRITTNVTLGRNIRGSVPIRRPVILLGMASALTSVDLEMVVNQLNVTPPTGTLVWQGLVLENLAPGGLWLGAAADVIFGLLAGRHMHSSEAVTKQLLRLSDRPHGLCPAAAHVCAVKQRSWPLLVLPWSGWEGTHQTWVYRLRTHHMQWWWDGACLGPDRGA
jgi:hypothetical protein